ncbi:MAG: hypothetical protein ABSD20_01005 [Terriglobales bacterium]
MKEILEENQVCDEEALGGVVVAASSCPAPECGSLVIDYRAADRLVSGHAGAWEFTCSRCGWEFVVDPDELIFQSVSKQWLSGGHVLGGDVDEIPPMPRRE